MAPVPGVNVAPYMLVIVQLGATPTFTYGRSYAVAVGRTIPIDSPRRRSGRRKLKIARDGDKVLSLCDYRRLKLCGVAGQRLKGRGFSDGMNVGPDEPTEDTHVTPGECFNLDDDVLLQCSQCFMFGFIESIDSVGGKTMTCTNCHASIYYPPEDNNGG